MINPDNENQVFFYERDFYILSNFSAFELKKDNITFPTSEHAYQHAKFCFNGADEIQLAIAHAIFKAPSAHEAFKLAEKYASVRNPQWDSVKLDIMKDILWKKFCQHEYVSRKLLATGTRELIEDSWRDNYWGWGPNRDGQNMLGRLWMEVRAEHLELNKGK
jgi:ribA/ribD-fused uncharacterized protein